MILDCQDDFFHRHIQPFCHCLDDANIRLVWHQPVEFFLRDASVLKGFRRDFAKRFDGNLEDFVAGHDDLRSIGTRRGQIGGLPDRIIKQVFMLPVRTQMTGDNALLFGRFQYDRACAIAEQYASVAITPVDELGDALGTYYQRAFSLAGFDEFVGGGQRIDKTRACRLKTESGACRYAKLVLDNGGYVGKNQVRRCRACDHHINLGDIDARSFDGILRSFDTHVRRCLLGSANMPTLNPCSCANPLVGRIDDFFEIGVRHDSFGEISPRSNNARILHTVSFCSRVPICCGN